MILAIGGPMRVAIDSRGFLAQHLAHHRQEHWLEVAVDTCHQPVPDAIGHFFCFLGWQRALRD